MNIDFATVVLTSISDPLELQEVLANGDSVEIGSWWLVEGRSVLLTQLLDHGPATLRLSPGAPEENALGGWRNLGEAILPLGPDVYAASASTEGYVPAPLASIGTRGDYVVREFGRVDGDTAHYWVFVTPAPAIAAQPVATWSREPAELP